MTESYLHGIETVEIDDGVRSIQTVKSSVIGLIGTAPDANAAAFPLNTPVRLSGPRMASKLGATGTLADAVDGIWDQGSATIVVVRVAAGETEEDTLSNLVGSSATFTGVHAFRAAEPKIALTPRLLIAPGWTHQRTQGVSAIDVDDEGAGYTHATVTISGGGGTGASATATIAGGKITGIAIVQAGRGFTGTPVVTITGDGTGAAATATVAATANPVVAEMLGVAGRLRAMVFADAPAGSNEDAIAWRGDFDSARLVALAPNVLVWDDATSTARAAPLSPRVVGIQSVLDNTRGFWWPASNKVFNGVVGQSRVIDFGLSDSDCEANYLNGNQIATIIHYDGGYRVWGVRSCASDPMWAFYSVRRTVDMVEESIERAMLWAEDRPISRQLIEDIEGSVRAYLDALKARGAILGGECWIDREINSVTDLMAGELFVDFDLEPPAPLEHLVFRVHRNSGYYEELLTSVTAAPATTD